MHQMKMAADEISILLVDDDPILCELHKTFLENMGYVVLIAENGRQAIKLIDNPEIAFSAILCDVIMPEMDGYQLCETLKANNQSKNIPFIFISSLTDLEEKVKGYAKGGDDYVTKPVVPEELEQKLKRLICTYNDKAKLNNQLTDATSTAMQAMSYSGELGRIIKFFEDSLNANDFESLSGHLFSILASYGLNCSIQIHTGSEILNFCERGKVVPLEADIMALARKKSRFFDFGRRTVINYKDFSLLIKNMPIEDPGKYGQSKDTLGTLCNVIENKIKSLISNNKNTKKNDIISMINKTMNQIEETFTRVQKNNITAIEDMMQDIEEAILHLCLTESQEENLKNIVALCLDKSNDAFYEGIALSARIEETRKTLESILDS